MDISKYTHPPITEAVIQFRFINTVDQNSLKKIATKLNKKFYKNKQDTISVNFRFQLTDAINEHSETKLKQEGYRLSSEDEVDILIIDPHAFTISRLAPYPGWDVFYEKFTMAWKIWREVVKKQEISRIGIRYINRIDIPIDKRNSIEISDYLNFYPHDCIFTDIPMKDYLIQITKRTSSPLWSATTISTQHPSPLLETISLVLDIDIYRTEEIPLDNNKLLLTLLEARAIKNEIFKQCITSRTEDLFR